MSRIVDNLVAYRILSMIVTPFEDSKAYKLGIIDANGKNLKKASALKTSEERNQYSYLHRLVFNMKRIINKLPGGESKTRNLIAALWLVKEYYEGSKRTTSLMESKYKDILRLLNNNVVLAEEELVVKKFINSVEEDAPVNATGAAVSTDTTVVKKKDIKKYITKRKVKVV